MGTRHILPLLTAIVAGIASPVLAEPTLKKEIDVSFAPLEVVKPVLDPVLSPLGKFLIFANKGTVLVIDTPGGILAAEQAIAAAQFPPADVALEFQFVTGPPARKTSIMVGQEVPFPTAFVPPTLIVGPNGTVTGFVPATPTEFRTRNIGVTSESVSTVNPDGSITLDLNTGSTVFEGFITYGSAALPSGGIGVVPVNGQVADPLFFAPFINAGGISLPIISTTRISTSIVIRPRLEVGVIHLEMMPRLKLEIDGSEMEPQLIDLRAYQTTLPVANHQVGRLHGFTGADDTFHRHFFGAKDLTTGGTAIVVKAKASPPGSAAPEKNSE